MYIEGLNPALTYVAATETPLPFRVGQIGVDNLGRQFTFATSTAALTAGDLVMLPLGNTGNVTALITSAAVYNRRAAIVPVTFAAATGGTGFWAQTDGQAYAGVKCSAAVAISVPLYTTATTSACDDTAAASNLIRGLTLTTLASGAAVAPAFLNNITIGNIADLDTIGAS